ncbi:hypothetical protein Acsp06_30370 [Actinomycetospora sp. NBRC 106375]|uniref:DUF7002 family protein n=1 Tax=Actinomycetospora sp. NBRC 106375 TaxID=3032207 RepID=UPI0024A5567E|nr:hypothetical protein [Actinomycetospora sp. NBRC 106375]GLZ46852.1 hypothetical protein Acsp06_30370 [Actinomycetospora sp. NBRC 106375]
MAEPGAWPSIRAHGLASAAALVERFGAATELVSARRPVAVTLSAPGRDPVVLRDNGVLHDGQLARCLEGMEIGAFYRMLNDRVYLWPTRRRVAGLLAARAYRDRAHLVLELDTAALLDRHGAAVRLSPINMGATLITPPPRGPHTARPLGDWPRDRTIAEVSVEHAIPDAADLVAAAAVHQPDGAVVPVDLDD